MVHLAPHHRTSLHTIAYAFGPPARADFIKHLSQCTVVIELNLNGILSECPVHCFNEQSEILSYGRFGNLEAVDFEGIEPSLLATNDEANVFRPDTPRVFEDRLISPLVLCWQALAGTFSSFCSDATLHSRSFPKAVWLHMQGQLDF